MAGPGLPESITAGVTTGHVTDHEKIHDLLNEFDTTDQASTKGDLLVVSGGTIKRLAVGSDGQALVADSAVTPGVKWGAATDVDAIHDNVAGEIAAVTEKATPVSADLILIEDSAAANAKKKVQIGNLPSGGGASALNDLTDVVIATPLTGEVLKYNGTNWVNDDDDVGSGLPTASTKGDIAVYNGTAWVVVSAGTDDHVLTADAAQAAGVKWAAAAGGGGGDPYIIEPGLKPPGTAHADDDEFNQANATDPTTTGWSWGNQQSATAAVNSGILGIDASTSTARGIHGLFQAVPAGDVSISTRATSTTRTNFHAAAIVFLWGTLATPTELEVVRHVTANGIVAVYWDRYTGYGSWSSTRSNTVDLGIAPLYLRLKWDDTAGTVRGFWSPRVTASALSWVALSAAQSKGSAPDFMGIAVSDESGSTNLPIAFFDFFRVNWTPDFDPTG